MLIVLTRVTLCPPNSLGKKIRISEIHWGIPELYLLSSHESMSRWSVHLLDSSLFSKERCSKKLNPAKLRQTIKNCLSCVRPQGPGLQIATVVKTHERHEHTQHISHFPSAYRCDVKTIFLTWISIQEQSQMSSCTSSRANTAVNTHSHCSVHQSHILPCALQLRYMPRRQLRRREL